jgi:hypothetical protein
MLRVVNNLLRKDKDEVASMKSGELLGQRGEVSARCELDQRQAPRLFAKGMQA